MKQHFQLQPAALGDNALMEKAWQDTGMLAESMASYIYIYSQDFIIKHLYIKLKLLNKFYLFTLYISYNLSNNGNLVISI